MRLPAARRRESALWGGRIPSALPRPASPAGRAAQGTVPALFALLSPVPALRRRRRGRDALSRIKSPLPQSPAQPGRLDGRKKGGAEKAVFPLTGPAPLFLTAGEASRRTEPGGGFRDVRRQASGGVFPCRGKKKAFPCPRADRVRPQKVKSAARTENLSIKIFLFFEERPAGRS